MQQEGMTEHPMRRYRREKAMPLDQLAEATGVDKSTLSRIERGKQNPSIDLLRRLIAATGGALSAEDFCAPQVRGGESSAA